MQEGTTPGQGLFLQSYCISSIHGGQMEEVESRRQQRSSRELVRHGG